MYLIDSNGKLLTTIINSVYYEEGVHKIAWNSFINENRAPANFYTLIRSLMIELLLMKKS